jgi:dihydropyrimidinase/allantoinase
MYDLVIKNGLVVSGARTEAVDLAISDGKIVGRLSPGTGIEGSQTVDAAGMHVFPGVVDGHCHMRDPGRMEREDFWTGTQAAAAGGITTACEMPISIPPVYTAEIFRQRAETVQPRALIDFALYGTAGYENLDHIQGLADAGAVAFKTYLHPAEPGREKEFTGLICPDSASQYEAMEAVARTGRRHCLHCETNELVGLFTSRMKKTGRTDGRVHSESRPAVCEDASVALSLAMGASLGASLVICHMSSAGALQLVKEAKSRGVDVVAETCPSYLFMSDDYLETFGAYAKNNPPLRSEENRQRLWDYLHDGTIDYIATDHSPWRPESKDGGIFVANSGIASFDMILPLLIDAVNRGLIGAEKVASMLSEKPAEVFKLAQKGHLQPGYDADFVLVDMSGTFVFDKSKSYSKAGETMKAFDGMKLSGRIKSTWVRGTRVHEDGRTAANPGHGRLVTPR